MEHRDSPEIEPGRLDEEDSKPGRRFARLVESPVSRRVALPRLVVAGGLALSAVGLALWGVARLLQGLTTWVHRQSEHQIPFAQIELVPEPDPWIKGGKALILDKVRVEANLGETISLLEVDLAKLQQDFQRCPWVKRVVRIDKSRYGRLIVELVYRRPVAEVRYEKAPPGDFILDEEAVVLPDREIDWTSHLFPYRVKGIDAPLIQIADLPESSTSPSFGVPWKRKVEDGSVDEPEPMVLRAAKLARFLQDRKLALKSPGMAPDFVSIHIPHEPDGPFFLLAADRTCVCWGTAPGDEKPAQPSTEARWGMLLDRIKRHGLADARYPDYLDLRTTEPLIHQDRGGSGRSGRPPSR